MAKIISASRRTDIPAFQADEFMADVRKGYRDLVNPYTKNVDRHYLIPKEVICFVFWTKNPEPMIKAGYLDELTEMGHKFYFNYTITCLNLIDPRLEPGVPSAYHQIDSLKKITSKYPNTVRWRYDPILFTDLADWNWHINNFQSTCGALRGHVSDCIFSFYQDYRKAAIRMQNRGINYHMPSESDQIKYAKELSAIAWGYGIRLLSCAQPLFEGVPEIGQSRCVDADFIAPLLTLGDPQLTNLMSLKKDKGQRKACGCVQSVDIGVYNTCPHSCAYCYANQEDA